MKEQCILGVAKKKNNLEMCDQLQEKFKDPCYVSVAFNTNNPHVCTTIADSYNRGQCYEGLAFKNKDASFCDNIQNNNAVLSCRNDVAHIKAAIQPQNK